MNAREQGDGAAVLRDIELRWPVSFSMAPYASDLLRARWRDASEATPARGAWLVVRIQGTRVRGQLYADGREADLGDLLQHSREHPLRNFSTPFSWDAVEARWWNDAENDMFHVEAHAESGKPLLSVSVRLEGGPGELVYATTQLFSMLGIPSGCYGAAVLDRVALVCGVASSISRRTPKAKGEPVLNVSRRKEYEKTSEIAGT